MYDEMTYEEYCDRYDDIGPEQTGIDCPLCGHEVAWTGSALVCDNCEVSWTDAADLEHTRRVVESFMPHEQALAEGVN